MEVLAFVIFEIIFSQLRNNDNAKLKHYCDSQPNNQQNSDVISNVLYLKFSTIINSLLHVNCRKAENVQSSSKQNAKKFS